MRTWIFLGFIIAIPLASGSLQPTDVPQLWAESGIDASFVHKLINETSCSSSEKYRRACLVAHAGTNQASANSQVALGQIANRLLREFDPHARIVPTEQLAVEHTLRGGDYVGIGITNSLSAQGLLVRQIFAGSPAAAAGLQVGDRIVRIDGEDAGNGSKLSGEVGKTLVLKIERQGRFFERRLTIATVVQQFLDARPIDFGGQKFGYLHVGRFVRGVCDALSSHLKEFKSRSGWILDLRGNPGGLMAEGACIAGALIGGRGRVLGERSVKVDLPTALGLKSHALSEDISWVEAWNSTEVQNTPLVVLIDHDSASASEIVAAALQDHGRALIVGERSFGKGTAQLVEVVPGMPKLSIVHTVSQFFRPSGVALQFYGVSPDFAVSLRRGTSLEDHSVAREANSFAHLVPAGPRSVVYELPRGFAIRTRECVDRQLSDPARWANITNAIGSTDNQLAHAVSALECSTSP